VRILQYFHPPRNIIQENYYQNFKRWHFFKFLINHKLQRVVVQLIYKFLYWALFKVMNRIEIQDRNKVFALKKEFKGQPFLIVENHCGGMDVLMNMTLWSHLGFLTFVFTNEGSFSPYHPILTMTSHFAELVPRFGSGKSSINRIANRLQMGDIINIFPGGSYPSGKYVNSGFVQEGFSGAARVAYQYWKETGRKLIIQPSCAIGMNRAYPPRYWKKDPKRILNHKVIVKFGEAFTLNFSNELQYSEIQEKTTEIQMKIASIWNQKKLFPNYSKEWLRKQGGGAGQPRKYSSLKKKRMGKKRRRKKSQQKKHHKEIKLKVSN
jgi:1-acyl-sn-glycerol-3-phosphate acyltransferase